MNSRISRLARVFPAIYCQFVPQTIHHLTIRHGQITWATHTTMAMDQLRISEAHLSKWRRDTSVTGIS